MMRPENIWGRFWSKVERSDECWLWTGSLVDGYGQFWVNDRMMKAHRWSYEQANGSIPSGRDLDHLCRTRNCVRPDHLEAVTRRENILRGEGLAAQAARQTTCINGHPFDRVTPRKNGRTQRSCSVCARARKDAFDARRKESADA